MATDEIDLTARRAAYVEDLEAALGKAIGTLSRLPGIERVSVFGSYARGRRDLLTDLDLLVIWSTDKAPLDRLRFLYPHLDIPVDLDLVCYTPAEFRELRDSPFLRRIAAEETVVYEKPPA